MRDNPFAKKVKNNGDMCPICMRRLVWSSGKLVCAFQLCKRYGR